MTKNKRSSRFLAMFLVILMVMSVMPLSVWAATVGDVTNVDTGLTGDIDKNDTISLPIQILDYESDGMLFEYAEAVGEKSAADFGASWYKNFTNKETTAEIVSSEVLVTGSSVTASMQVANSYANYLKLKWKSNSNTSTYPPYYSGHAGVIMPNDLGGIAMKDVQYLVMVYRSNVTSGKIGFFVERSGADRHQTVNRVGELPFTSEGSANWTYAIYNLKQGNLGNSWSNYGNATAIWTSLPLGTNDDYIDIADIALFENEAQARKFGEYALTDGSDRGDNRGFGLLSSSRNQNSGDNFASVIVKTETVEQFNTKSGDFTQLTALGYKLLGEFNGIANIGLLESSLSPEGYPVYKEEVVTYVAELLQHSLTIPERTDGWKNYRYIKGTPSDTYGGVDIATALRQRITGGLGSYDASKAKTLIGEWNEVQGSIETYYDAAYFLLNSVAVNGSYNKPQNTYNYLVLSAGTDTVTGHKVHVFDAGFANTTDTQNTTPAAIDYNTDKKTIQNSSAIGKAHFYYVTNSTTTLNPFLPVTGQTQTVYYQDDGTRNPDTVKDTLVNRNFNYLLKSSGEFVYHADDELFFDFEGDDDVYLFINGELVMDIGSAHSIDGVRFYLNDYVNAAKAGTLGDAERNAALALEEGKTYTFNFFYMERHSFGANMRIMTNIHVTDPDMKTEKTAYQNGNQINYGGVIDSKQVVEYGFKITNTGDQNLYNLTFTDNDIGVTLDVNKGLTVKGSNVTDLNGNSLDATDLVAIVDGYSDWNLDEPTQKMETIRVTFQNNDALKAFLRDMTSAETQSGEGLWLHSTVEIRGIGYKLTDEQIEASRFDNMVFTASNTHKDGTGKPLQGQADMLVFVPADPMYYQWAGHDLVVDKEKFIGDVMAAANAAGNPLEGQTPDLKTTNVIKMEVTTSAGNPITNPSVVVTNDGLTINYPIAGSYVAYVKVTYISGENFVIVPVLVNVTSVEDSYFVLDYGLTVDLSTGNELTKNDKNFVPGRDTAWSLLAMGSNGTYADNHITFDSSASVACADGTYTFSENMLTYQPLRFMEGLDTVQVAFNVYEIGMTPAALGTALNINKEVQMYKNVTILPATVVYYEDCYPAIKYTEGENAIQQTGSFESLTKQSNDQTQEYGQDEAYQNNYDMSAETLTQITINNNELVSSFEFTGTGFEIISRTNATDSATFVVEVLDSNGTPIKNIPVITEFNNGDGDTETFAFNVDPDTGEEIEPTNATHCIYQVPVIRIDDLTFGMYKVNIKGIPAFKYDAEEPVTEYSCLYIDGVRIFKPLGETNEHYNDYENGASFYEVRDLIIEGKVAAIGYENIPLENPDADNSGENFPFEKLNVSTGTHTWVENYLGTTDDKEMWIQDPLKATWEGNTVDSVDAYLLCGPNNEVYLEGDATMCAIAFYVSETSLKQHSLQIAMRAVDLNAFFNGVDELYPATEYEPAVVRYGVVLDDGTYGWQTLATCTSGTEQYYMIDYKKAPKDELGRYQILIAVESGMVSISSLKLNGLTGNTINGEIADLVFVEGVLTDPNTNKAVETANYANFAMLSAQMASTYVLDSSESDTDDDVIVPEKPKKDDNPNKGPGNNSGNKDHHKNDQKKDKNEKRVENLIKRGKNNK